MKVLDTKLDAWAFLGRLAEAPERVLLLDYDGTLAPFRRSPERAKPYPRIARTLERAMQRQWTRVVVVSGRPLEALRGPLEWIPHTEAWGAHGWERRTASGERIGYEPGRSAERSLRRAEAAARPLERRGARIERKIASVAVHWRGLPQARALALHRELAHMWRALGDGLEPLEFDGGMEIRARGRGKGEAVREVLAACAPGAACAYLGDDMTDEDAFMAMAGRGLSVLVRRQFRATRADVWLAPPHELVGFLERWWETPP